MSGETRIPLSALWVSLAELEAAQAEIARLRNRVAELEAAAEVESPAYMALLRENKRLRRQVKKS